MVDGIYKITLRGTKNANFSVFMYIFVTKKTLRQSQYDEKHDGNLKMLKNFIKTRKNFFINAACAHSGRFIFEWDICKRLENFCTWLFTQFLRASRASVRSFRSAFSCFVKGILTVVDEISKIKRARR